MAGVVGVILSASLVVGCAGKRELTEIQIAAREFVRIINWFDGSFATGQGEDAVVLHHTKIWPSRGDGTWFYAEESLAGEPDAPTRQQIYRFWIRFDKQTEIKVFDLPDAARYAGAHADPSLLEGLTPKDLIEREGCEVEFVEIEGDHAAGTAANGACFIDQIRVSADELRLTGRTFVQPVVFERIN